MSQLTIYALDLVAITILTFGLYFPRHRRRDLLVAYLGVNVGVLSVAQALTAAEVNAGLGLGLFGVLSIIRLRSFELDHQEVAYYFVALALGLLAGIPLSTPWVAPVLMAALLAVAWVGDHPALLGRYRAQSVTLDHAITDEAALITRLEGLLGAKVHRVRVRRVDLVNDTTNVEVRFERLPEPATRAPETEQPGSAFAMASDGDRR